LRGSKLVGREREGLYRLSLTDQVARVHPAISPYHSKPHHTLMQRECVCGRAQACERLQTAQSPPRFVPLESS
jgi:hypothetical protein